MFRHHAGRTFRGLVGMLALTAWPLEVSAAPHLSASATADSPSNDGTFMLEWGDPSAQGVVYHVQLAAPPNEARFEDWYRGPATQSFVSGIPDGTARVRVRSAPSVSEGEAPDWGAWSEPLRVPVAHHPMNEALALMGLGAVVFLFIAGYVVQGSLRAAKGTA